ncbi:MAG: hypothetical protein PUD59_06600 [bacterium]|nr:hypothetical protein [bacterium]
MVPPDDHGFYLFEYTYTEFIKEFGEGKATEESDHGNACAQDPEPEIEKGVGERGEQNGKCGENTCD